MKKIILAFAAFVAAFNLVSCNKEQLDEQTSASEIKLNISVGNLDGTTDTKAVKTGWENGDQINIWYDMNVTQNPDLVIVYNGTTWNVDESATVSGATPSAEGTLNAVYVQGGLSQMSDYHWSSDRSAYFSTGITSYSVDGIRLFSPCPLVSYVETATYSYGSETLTTSLIDWDFSNTNNVQVVITELPEEGDWALKCDNLGSRYLFMFDDGGFMDRPITYDDGRYVLPVNNADGKAFMFSTYAYSSGYFDFLFTLYNIATGEKLNYLASGKKLDTSGKLNAVKIPFRKFEGEYVDLGLSVNWSRCNLGTIEPQGYGNYYLWAGQYNTSTGGFNAPYHDSMFGDNGGWSKYIPNNSYVYGTNGFDNKTTLDRTDDAAYLALGGKWRMPTEAEWTELIENCTCIPTTLNGTYGFKMQSTKEGFTDKSIFLPAAGEIIGWGEGEPAGSGEYGLYWTSSVYVDEPSKAYMARLHTNNPTVLTAERKYAYSVRPVCTK